MKALDAFLPEYEFSEVRRLVDLGTRLEDAPGEGLVLRFEGDFWRLRGSRRGDSCTAVLDFRVANGELTTETRAEAAT
jgi:hypothetical protein